METTDSALGDVTALLVRWGGGDAEALGELTPIVYQELRSLARMYMSQERPDHTLQPTALVNELFLRLFGERKLNWRDRAHFFGVAAKLMRRVLVDYARKKQAAKRTGISFAMDLSSSTICIDEELLAIDQALVRLEAIDARKARVVESRYFGGMTTEETANALAISVATAERDWSMAKAWLYRELKTQAGSKNGPRPLEP